MTHAEFVARHGAPGFVWGVRRFEAAVVATWGAGYLAVLVLAASIPALALVAAAASLERPLLLMWVVPALWGVLAGPPNVNCVDALPFVGCGPLSYVAGLAAIAWLGLGDDVPALALTAGLAPLAAYYVSGMIRGATLISLGERLVASPETYQRLESAGLLVLRP